MGILRVAAAFKRSETWGNAENRMSRHEFFAVVAQMPCDFSQLANATYRKGIGDRWMAVTEAALESIDWPARKNEAEGAAGGKRNKTSAKKPLVILEWLTHPTTPEKSLLVAHLPEIARMNGQEEKRTTREWRDALQNAVSQFLEAPAIDFHDGATLAGVGGASGMAVQQIAWVNNKRPTAALEDELRGEAAMVLSKIFKAPQFIAQKEAAELSLAMAAEPLAEKQRPKGQKNKKIRGEASAKQQNPRRL